MKSQQIIQSNLRCYPPVANHRNSEVNPFNINDLSNQLASVKNEHYFFGPGLKGGQHIDLPVQIY